MKNESKYKMKQKISITVDEEMVELIEDKLKDGKFRNRSHVVECSLREFIGNAE